MLYILFVKINYIRKDTGYVAFNGFEVELGILFLKSLSNVIRLDSDEELRPHTHILKCC